MQAIAALSLANSAYQDEALYIYAGKQILHQILGQPVAVKYGITSLSGFPYLYPVIAGVLDSLGGLVLVRLFSLACMLISTAAVYRLTLTLYGPMSARLATALFAVQGPVLFLSNFATYDAMCLSLMAVTAVLVLYAAAARRPWLSLAVGPMIGVMVLTKYAGALFAPTLLILLVYQTRQRWGWRQSLARLCCALSLLLLGAFEVAHVAGHDLLTTLNSAYLERQPASYDSRLHLVERVWSLGAAILVLALVGLLLGGRQGRLLRTILFVSALLAPAYHIYVHELVALHKHLAFSMVFAAPLAGRALARLAGYRWLTGIVGCLVVLSMGLAASKELYNEWPNTSNLITVLRAQNLPPHSQVLAEPGYESQYYLDDARHWDFTTLWAFTYFDPSGRVLNGVPAYNDAIMYGYFDLVVLGYGPGDDTRAIAVQIDSGLRHGTTYTLIAKVPYSSAYGTGNWWVWRKRPAAAAAPVPRSAVPGTGSAVSSPVLSVHNRTHTVTGGRVQPCDLRQNTGGAIEPGCEIVSAEWLPGARVTYTLRYPDGATQTFVDIADSRGHSLHAFQVSYRPPVHVAHGQPATVATIQIRVASADGRRAASARSRFTVMP